MLLYLGGGDERECRFDDGRQRCRAVSTCESLAYNRAMHDALVMATEFLNAVRVRPCFFSTPESIRPFPYFLGGWRVRMSIIRTAIIPKIGKIGAKIRASVD